MTIDSRKQVLPDGWRVIRKGAFVTCGEADVGGYDGDCILSTEKGISDKRFEEAIQILRLMRDRGKK